MIHLPPGLYNVVRRELCEFLRRYKLPRTLQGALWFLLLVVPAAVQLCYAVIHECPGAS